MKKYKFVGNSELLQFIDPKLMGHHIKSTKDIENWIKINHQKFDFNVEITATFVIDLDFNLLINDRHSEHIVCANGKEVFSAGEITFKLLKNKTIIISKITNQSTGYCPSSASWDAVKISLEKTDILFPEFFTTFFEFRICEKCHWINVIKDEYFVCLNDNCQNELPKNEI